MPEFERIAEIDAPIETVWNVMTDPHSWPQWFPGIDRIVHVSATGLGASVEFSNDGHMGRATVVKMEPLRLLEVKTQLGDDYDSHIFKLTANNGFLGLSDETCKVAYTLDTQKGGGILESFAPAGTPKDAAQVNNVMHQSLSWLRACSFEVLDVYRV